MSDIDLWWNNGVGLDGSCSLSSEESSAFTSSVLFDTAGGSASNGSKMSSCVCTSKLKTFGCMLRVGQNTRARLLSGILVVLECSDVHLSSRHSSRRTLRFSRGSCQISLCSSSTKDRGAVRWLWKPRGVVPGVLFRTLSKEELRACVMIGSGTNSCTV